jgi:hypothetical protein
VPTVCEKGDVPEEVGLVAEVDVDIGHVHEERGRPDHEKGDQHPFFAI